MLPPGYASAVCLHIYIVITIIVISVNLTRMFVGGLQICGSSAHIGGAGAAHVMHPIASIGVFTL